MATRFQEYKEYMVGLARAKLVQRQLKSTGLWKGMHVNLNSHSSHGLLGGGGGSPHSDHLQLTFFTWPFGALPSFPSPPAVALLFPGYQLI